MPSWKRKAVIAGDKMRVITVPERILYGFESNRKNYDKNADGEKSDISLRRAQDNLVLTIDANVSEYTKLITLTFGDKVLDRQKAMRKFQTFRINFRRKFGMKLKYAGVTERQKKRGKKEGNAGTWHFHLAVFVDDYLPFEKLKACWPHGSVDVKAIDDVKNVGRYLGKYMTKSDNDVGLNAKAVLKSHGLRKPIIVYDDNVPFDVSDAKPEYSTAYDVVNEGTGEVKPLQMSEYSISHLRQNGKDATLNDAYRIFGRDTVRVNNITLKGLDLY